MSTKTELSKQQKKSQETKEKIFQAAKKILQKSGYEKLSIKNICEEAGVSNGSFYHHFKTKDDLLSYYIEDQPTMGPDLLETPKSLEDVKDGIVRVYLNYVAYCRELGVEFMAGYYDTKNQALNPAIRTERPYPIVTVQAYVEQAAKDGIINIRESIDEFTTDIRMIVIGNVFEWCLREGNADFEGNMSRSLRRYLDSTLEEPELFRKRIDYQIHLTTKKKDAGKIASEITEDGQEHMLVVLGGDGTLNEVLSGIKSLEKVTLGYIPIGSSNDFARGTGIPGDPFEALDTILSPKRVEKMDIGVLKREGKGRRFAVSAGIGFDAAVCHEVCVSKWKRVLNLLKIGKLSYAVVAMDRIIKDRPVKLELTLDDGSMKVFERTYFAAFMNLPYEGGGFKFCPDASGSDGFLDIMVVSDLSKLKILCLLPTAFSGKHTRFKGVTILKCRSVKVVTDRALPLHTDGEPSFLSKEIEVSLEKEKLNVIVE